MNIRTKTAGLIIAASLCVAAGASQALCSPCDMRAGPTGIGWGYVPCDTHIRPAVTWEQYYSGGYTAPVGGRGFLFFW